MAKSSACYKSINSQRSKIKNTDWPWDKHYTSREGAQLGIPSRSELARHTRSSNTSEQHSPWSNSRWQNWKQDSIPAMEMVHSSCKKHCSHLQHLPKTTAWPPGSHLAQDRVLTSTMSCPQPDSSGHLQEWRFPRQRSPDHVKLVIFTWNKLKLYKLDSLTQWDLMCRYCQLWGVKSPNFFFFPPILFRIHFFCKLPTDIQN